MDDFDFLLSGHLLHGFFRLDHCETIANNTLILTTRTSPRIAAIVFSIDYIENIDSAPLFSSSASLFATSIPDPISKDRIRLYKAMSLL